MVSDKLRNFAYIKNRACEGTYERPESDRALSGRQTICRNFYDKLFMMRQSYYLKLSGGQELW